MFEYLSWIGNHSHLDVKIDGLFVLENKQHYYVFVKCIMKEYCKNRLQNSER